MEGNFACKVNPNKFHSGTPKDTEDFTWKIKPDLKINQSAVAIKSEVLGKLRLKCSESDYEQKLDESKFGIINHDVASPFHVLEAVKNILDSLDFENYKCRYFFDDMD